jgi:hypothetical protein
VPVGFDPNRPHRSRPSDYVFVGSALLVVVVLIAWVLLG